MAVGNQLTKATIDNQLSTYAAQLRDLCQQILNLSLTVNGQNAGLAFLENAGYSNTANPNNPGSASDAAYALQQLSYLNTVPEVYIGAAAQTPAFNFNQQLSPLWGGQ
jgi:hypothetical protein